MSTTVVYVAQRKCVLSAKSKTGQVAPQSIHYCVTAPRHSRCRVYSQSVIEADT
jgi:hypothetical protein